MAWIYFVVYFVPAVLRCGVQARGILKKTQIELRSDATTIPFGRSVLVIFHATRHTCEGNRTSYENYKQHRLTDSRSEFSIVPLIRHTTANRPIPHSTGANKFSRNSHPHCPERKQARSLRFDYECTFNSSF